MTSINDAFGSRAVRGIMTNADPLNPLGLSFQLNPTRIRFDKQPRYEIDQVPGFDDPVITWISGGPKFIDFDLFFDTTQGAVDSGLTKIISPLKGSLGIEAVLESFLRQRTNLIDELLGVDPIEEPPDCILLLGLRWFQCKLLSAPIEEVLFNKLLVPQRITVPIRLVVEESGAFKRIDRIRRMTMALEESALTTTTTLLSTLV